MPAERLPMRNVREVLRLRHASGASVRMIAHCVGVGRTTVAEYLRRVPVLGITWPVPTELDDAAALERRLFAVTRRSHPTTHSPASHERNFSGGPGPAGGRGQRAGHANAHGSHVVLVHQLGGQQGDVRRGWVPPCGPPARVTLALGRCPGRGGKGMEPRPPRRVTLAPRAPAAWGRSRAPVKVGTEEAEVRTMVIWTTVASPGPARMQPWRTANRERAVPGGVDRLPACGMMSHDPVVRRQADRGAVP